MLNFTCTDNGGFEDQLSEGTTYYIKEVGCNSYLLKNDNDEEAWYGQSHFTMKLSS